MDAKEAVMFGVLQFVQIVVVLVVLVTVLELHKELLVDVMDIQMQLHLVIVHVFMIAILVVIIQMLPLDVQPVRIGAVDIVEFKMMVLHVEQVM